MQLKHLSLIPKMAKHSIDTHLDKGKNSVFLFCLLVTVFTFGGIVLTLLIGNEGICRLFNLPAMPRSFADIANLVWGAQSIAAGYDPLYLNPFDQFGREMNTSKFVQLLVTMFHFDHFSVEAVAYFVISIFLFSICVVFRYLDRWSAIFLALALLSPPIVLGIERANHDLFVFALVALGLRFNQRARFFFALAMVASFIKFFPVFGITYFLKYTWRKWLFTSLAFGGLFVAYLILNLQDLEQIFNSTDKSFAFSYGIRVFVFFVTGENADFVRIVAFIPWLAILFILSAQLFSSYGESGWHLLGDVRYIDAFRVGSGVYLGVFLLGNNWDYRLIYLLLTIPQLTDWAWYQRKWLARFTFGFLFLSLFIQLIAPFGKIQFIIDETSNWTLWGLLFVLMVRSVPENIYKGFRSWSAAKSSSEAIESSSSTS